MECAFHPGVETVLRCGKCEAPICPRCIIHTPVGARCRKCARLQRLPTYTVPPLFALRGVLAGVGAGSVWGAFLGFAPWLLLPMPPFLLFWLYPLGIGASGVLVAEAVGWATNRKRGPLLQGVAVSGVVVAVALAEAASPWLLLGNLWNILALLIALALAVGRLR